MDGRYYDKIKFSDPHLYLWIQYQFKKSNIFHYQQQIIFVNTKIPYKLNQIDAL